METEKKVIEIFRLQCNFYHDITLALKSLNEENQEIIKRIFPNLLKDEKRRKKRNKNKSSYYASVWRHTELNSINLEGIEKRGFLKYDIDHIVPISYGYKNNIPPELIGSISNLRVISSKENVKKGDRLTKESEELLKRWNYKNE